MPRTLKINYSTPSLAAATEDELISKETWAIVPIDEALIIKSLGLFGDSTSGTYYKLFVDDREAIPKSPPDYTAFNKDYLQYPGFQIAPGSKLQLKVYNAAAAAKVYQFVAEFVYFKEGEL